MYLFGETWYKLLPNPVKSIAPTIVKLLTKASWKYTNSSSLATSGIYSQSDLGQLRDHIMFPAEKPMILNSLAREITGHPTINQGISLTNIFNEDVIDKIAESAWGRFWTSFTSYGPCLKFRTNSGHRILSETIRNQGGFCHPDFIPSGLEFVRSTISKLKSEYHPFLSDISTVRRTLSIRILSEHVGNM